ncbi:MAG TPA: hypothetical protein VHV30_02120 [Polyangiaceae bacterium]|jgi:hypothetical protein|nr:hypothetical protein [Polyangiaceae bacterium]
MSKTDLEPFEGLFERARHDAFSPAETDRLWQSVTAAGQVPGGSVGPGSGLGSAANGAARSGATGWSGAAGAVKIMAVLLVAGGLGAAGLAAARSRAPAIEVPVATVAAPPLPVGRTVPAAAPEVAGPPTVSWEELPRSPEAPPAAAPVHLRAHTAGSGPVERAPEVEAPEVPPAPATSPIEAPENPPAETAAPSEGALLLRARQHLASDPGTTLALTDEASRRFPAGPLAPEREVLAIEALAKLGRSGEARARFATFRVRYPRSPHLARLDAVLDH